MKTAFLVLATMVVFAIITKTVFVVIQAFDSLHDRIDALEGKKKE